MDIQDMDTSEIIIPFTIDDDKKTVNIIAYTDFFDKKCILHISNNLINKYYISFHPESDKKIIINIKSKYNLPINESIVRQFIDDMIEYQTWLDLNKEFGSIRDLIVEQAFSSTK